MRDRAQEGNKHVYDVMKNVQKLYVCTILCVYKLLLSVLMGFITY